MSEETSVRLGSLLRQTRELRNMSVRRTAEKVGISATYLGQLEADAVKEPSPHILHRFAEVFGVSYADLMRAAGYVLPRGGDPAGEAAAPPHPLDAALHTTAPLSEAEREALSEYLAWYRSRRGRRKERW